MWNFEKIFINTVLVIGNNSTVPFKESIFANLTVENGFFGKEGGGRINLFNNIIWGNIANSSEDIWVEPVHGRTGVVDAFHNDFSSVVSIAPADAFGTMVADIYENPGFLAPDDVHLADDSICVDRGTSDAPNLPAMDIDGQKRAMPGSWGQIPLRTWGPMRWLRPARETWTLTMTLTVMIWPFICSFWPRGRSPCP